MNVSEILAGTMKELVELSTRIARCRCGRVAESNWDLAFFEYRGPGSRAAVEICRCGYYMTAHNLPAGKRPRPMCNRPEKRGPWDHDTFLCGACCRELD